MGQKHVPLTVGVTYQGTEALGDTEASGGHRPRDPPHAEWKSTGLGVT